MLVIRAPASSEPIVLKTLGLYAFDSFAVCTESLRIDSAECPLRSYLAYVTSSLYPVTPCHPSLRPKLKYKPITAHSMPQCKRKPNHIPLTVRRTDNRLALAGPTILGIIIIHILQITLLEGPAHTVPGTDHDLRNEALDHGASPAFQSP